MSYTGEQLAVIHHQAGHARVDAVAGSGKTHTMVGRVAHLVQARAVAPRRIMVLMFNKSAQLQFRERLVKALGDQGRQVTVRTYHSLGFKLTELFTSRGLLPDYRLETQEWVLQKMAKAAVTEAFQRGHGKGYPSEEIRDEFLRFIDLVKSDLIAPEEAFEWLEFSVEHRYFVDAYHRFEEVRRENRLRFFADLLYEPVQVLKTRPEAQALIADKVEHIIADEYQDTNAIQEELLRHIAGQRAEVMVVGDVDQCIYEWRGAKPELIVSGFAAHFPNPATYTLSHTFRYGHAISLFANSVISHNQLRIEKLCVSAEGTPDTRIEHATVGGKSHPAGEVIERWRSGGRALAEAVVLVRKFSQSVPVELTLLQRGIPYRVEGRDSLFHTREINALFTLLKLAAGRLDSGKPEEVAQGIEDLLSTPHLGMKGELLAPISRRMARHPEQAATILRDLRSGVNPWLEDRIVERATLWAEIQRGDWQGLSPAQIVTRYTAHTEARQQFGRMAATKEDADEKWLACEGFTEFCRAQELALHPLVDFIEQLRSAERTSAPEEHVTITTIHRAKGLEWPLVIIAGLANAQFPGEDLGPEDMEAERRLFYVGATRAREQLVLAIPPDPALEQCIRQGRREPPIDPAATPFVYEGNLRVATEVGACLTGRQVNAPSAAVPGPANRYLELIGSALRVERRAQRRADTPRPEIETPHFRRGMRVNHPKFGPGIVSSWDVSAGRVQVQFDRVGQKTLVAEFAQLEVIR